MLVVALQLGLRREVLHFGPDEALQPAQEAFDLLASFCLFISSILSARWARKSCTTSERSSLAMKLPAASQKGHPPGLGVQGFAVGAELLEASGGRGRDAIIDS